MPVSEAVHTDLKALLTSIRRHLHMQPEIGLQEYKTASFIRATLEAHGLEVVGPLAETGLYVDIIGVEDGPMIGYRADIDALPIQDAKDVPYRSTVDCVAHLCGHDAHTAIAIGVALLLAERRNELQGRVRVFFQPNEEGFPSGAALMIRDGVLNDVEAVYACHVDPTLDVGRFGLISGPATAAGDRFRVRLKTSSTGHSARPHQSVDTMWAAVQVANSLYQVPGRVTDARNANVLTICRFHGGDAYNVIPDEIEFGGTLRTVDRRDRDILHRRIREAAENAAATAGAAAHVIFDQGIPAVINDDRLIDNVAESIEDLFSSAAVYMIPLPSMGGEDFAHYIEHVPGALIRVGTRSSDATAFPLHHGCFDVDEHSLEPAACMMADALIRHLNERVI
jgi:amidohydrolase